MKSGRIKTFKNEEDETMNFLTTTFSPAMVSPGLQFSGQELNLEEAKASLDAFGPLTSAVGHEPTACVLSALLERKVEFNRVNLNLKDGDCVLAIVPNFRASETREFTFEEVSSAGFRCFEVMVSAKIAPEPRYESQEQMLNSWYA
jgi:hypothetical protein